RDVLDFNRPVNLASLMIDAAIWGKAPFGYHLTSVLLHAANVVLVWAVMRAAARGDDGSASWIVGRLPRVLAPLLFAVHPLVTEPVCEPTFREDLLVAFFTLAGLLLAMGHDPRRTGIDGWRAAGCAGCSLLAIGAKESGIAAPCVVAAYWLLFRRAEPAGFWALAAGGAKLLVLCFLAARFLLEPSPSNIFEARPQYPGGSFAAAMAIEPRILALYAQLVIFPVNLCADYGLHSVRHLPLPLAVAILAAVAVTGVLAARADRRQALAAVLIVAPLLPVANIVPIYRAAADRYLYLPLAGVALAVGWLFDGPWLAPRRQFRDAACVGLLAAVALLGMACAERQKVWKSSLALWEDAHRRNPLSHDAAAGLGEAFRESGRLPEAERATREAIRLSGGAVADDWATLALVVDAQGRETEAKQALSRAFELDRRLADPLDRVEARAMERPVAEELIRLRDELLRKGGEERLER
ncbi:MAG: hypothetical protein EBZ59_10000, partial [Planctomycetia bacterium]|nr:hypothetical protein [Planctomycetia bacterium]